MPSGGWNKGIRYRHKNHKYTQGQEILYCGRYYVIDYSLNRRHFAIQRARIVMEKYLGRLLKPEEVVHHINGDITDDRIENLMLFPNTNEHIKEHHRLLGHKTPAPHIYKPLVIKVPKYFLSI